MKWRHPNHGRLLVPRCWDRAADTAAEGIPWAVDNDCFNGFNRRAWLRMLLSLTGLPGCLFVNAPDVVSDHDATLRLFDEWEPTIRMTGFPVAFVLQNGATIESVPWDRADAAFVGGCTDWKLGAEAEGIVREARRLGKHVHMGRVNTYRRIRYASSIGCDSVDGTKWARFRDTYMPSGVEAVRHQQMRMEIG